jgi:hypothetical protein
MRLQPFAIHDLRRNFREARDVLLETHIVVGGYPGIGVELNQDVEIAVCSVIAPWHRAEQCCMAPAKRPA